MGCRERDSHQTLDDLKRWNREIAHFHRLLVEVVKFFGDRVKPNQVFYTGLNIMPSFGTFTPWFKSPFSTTTSLSVAKRFSGEDQEGVILKLMGAMGCMARYFDVEWISCFHDEKERLFVDADNLMISDVRYFDGDHLLRNDHYLSAFRLFSSLFCGHFISPLIRSKKGKKEQKPWRVLVDLMTVYKATNGITKTMDNALTLRIPLYLQQLFYHLLDGFKSDKEMKYVIENEIDLLDESLKRELVVESPSISEHGHSDKLTLSPLMRTLCSVDRIALMRKYIWVIQGKQFQEIQSAKSSKGIESKMHHYTLSNGKRVSFVIVFRRKDGGSSSTGIGIKIKRTDVAVNARWSVMVDEVGYTLNGVSSWNLRTNGYNGMFAFEDHLCDEVESLTVTFALCMSARR